jgi:sulfoxide reductase heme-binding subunit YedZ
MPALIAFRLAAFFACLLPLLRLVWLGTHDGLSANPLEFVTRSTGTWALVFLCMSLSMTPLRRLTGKPQWMKFRRMLGLYCFFYAVLHFSLWFWIDHNLDPAEMWKDVLKRPFITAGFSAFVMLIPLAATSTKGMMRRLGINWVRLHRLVYLVAIAAILHYWWHKAGKNDFGTVGIYAAVVAVLLGIRLWWAGKGVAGRMLKKAPSAPASTSGCRRQS